MQEKYDVRGELSEQRQVKLKGVLGPGFHKGDQVWSNCGLYRRAYIHVQMYKSYYTKEMRHDLQNALEGVQ